MWLLWRHGLVCEPSLKRRQLNETCVRLPKAGACRYGRPYILATFQPLAAGWRRRSDRLLMWGTINESSGQIKASRGTTSTLPTDTDMMLVQRQRASLLPPGRAHRPPSDFVIFRVGNIPKLSSSRVRLSDSGGVPPVTFHVW